jgi:hypothetical protein
MDDLRWLLDREVECRCGRLAVVTKVKRSHPDGATSVHVTHFDAQTSESHTHTGDQVTALLGRTSAP